MPDILVRPAANDDDDLTGAFIMNDVTLPLTSQAALALGIPLGTPYEFQVLGAPALLTVTQPQISATNILRAESGGTAAVSFTRTTPVNLASYGTGDKIVVFAGAESALSTNPANHTLQGIPATSVQNGGGFNSGQRCAVVVFDLNAAGQAAANLVLTYAAAAQFDSVSVWAIKGGNVAVWVGGSVADTAWPFTGTGPTPANATNIVIATIMGRDGAQTATWGNMTEVSEQSIDVGSGIFTFIGDARAENLPTSPFLPTGSMSVTARRGAAMIVVTPL